MTQKILDTLRQAQSKKCAVFFSAKRIKKILPYTPFPCYSFPVTNTTKKTAIIVRNKQAKQVNAYYPNNIGRTFAELYTLAKQEANKIGGYITL